MLKIYSRFNSYILHNVQFVNVWSKPMLEVPSFLTYKVESRNKSFRRNPVKVIKHGSQKHGETFDEYFERVSSQADPRSIIKDVKPVHEVFKVKVGKKSGERGAGVDSQKPFIDEETESAEHKPLKNLHFKVFGNATEHIKKLLKIKSAQERDKHDAFTVEGWRLLAESLNAGLTPKAIFYSRSRLLGLMGPLMSLKEEDLVSRLNLFPHYKTPYKTMQIWSALKTSPGVAGVFSYSEVLEQRLNLPNGSLPLTVILDELKDPTNVGSILRTLVAAGVKKVLFTKGCCNPFESKCLRASAGALYRVNFEMNVEWKHMAGFVPEEPIVYLADSCKENNDPDYFTNMRNLENNINDSQHQNLTEEEVAKKFYNLNAELDNRNVERVYELDERGHKIFLDESYADENILKQFSNFPLQVQNFCNVDYYNEGNDVVLIIGGETGLSDCAKKFSFENCGVQVSIPMEDGTESLNSGVATGILVYDMLRNYRSKEKSKLESVDMG